MDKRPVGRDVPKYLRRDRVARAGVIGPQQANGGIAIGRGGVDDRQCVVAFFQFHAIGRRRVEVAVTFEDDGPFNVTIRSPRPGGGEHFVVADAGVDRAGPSRFEPPRRQRRGRRLAGFGEKCDEPRRSGTAGFASLRRGQNSRSTRAPCPPPLPARPVRRVDRTPRHQRDRDRRQHHNPSFIESRQSFRCRVACYENIRKLTTLIALLMFSDRSNNDGAIAELETHL